MHKRSLISALVFGALLAITGCGEDAPDLDPSVSLTVAPDFAPLVPAIRADVLNRRTLPILVGAACPPFSLITLIDEQGNVLNVWDPCAPYPLVACPQYQALEPRQTTTQYLPIPGVYWPSGDCQSVPMTPGRYRAVFRLPFRGQSESRSREVVQEIAFDWPLSELSGP